MILGIEKTVVRHIRGKKVWCAWWWWWCWMNCKYLCMILVRSESGPNLKDFFLYSTLQFHRPKQIYISFTFIISFHVTHPFSGGSTRNIMFALTWWKRIYLIRKPVLVRVANPKATCKCQKSDEVIIMNYHFVCIRKLRKRMWKWIGVIFACFYPNGFARAGRTAGRNQTRHKRFTESIWKNENSTFQMQMQNSSPESHSWFRQSSVARKTQFMSATV